jgi:hypothetical protein
MKNQVRHLIVLLLLATSICAQAAVWRINPDPSSTAHFNSLNSAVSDASVVNGDILHLEGNQLYVASNPGSEYQGIVTKQLSLIGPGYFIADNNAGWDVEEALCGIITMGAGSNGSSLQGLTIQQLIIQANNVTIQSCNINTAQLNNALNAIFNGNYIHSDVPGVPAIVASFSAGNLFSYNIIKSDFAVASPQPVIQELGSSGSVYTHNVIADGVSEVDDAAFSDNIFVNHTFDVIGICTLVNNLFDQFTSPIATFTPGGLPNDMFELQNPPNNNQTDVDMTLVIVGLPTSSPDTAFDIVPGGLADGTASDGTNIGVFQVGVDTYVPGGMLAVPLVTNLDVPLSTNTLYIMPVNFAALSTDGFTNLVAGEYFFDNDPGFGNGTLFTIADISPLINFGFFAVDVQALADGPHVLGCRVLDEEGIWSMSFEADFVKEGVPQLPTFNRLLYTIDGTGNFTAATSVDNPTPGTTDPVFSIFQDLSELSPGIHTLRIRAVDEFGAQSTTFVTTILVTEDPQPVPDLKSFEYWVDVDPGYNNGFQFDVPAGTGDLFEGDIPMDITGLPLGPHDVWIRAKDIDGAYGVTQKRTIYIVSDLFELADVNNDCVINVQDFLILLSNYGCSGDPFDPCPMDLSGDGSINTDDLLVFFGVFGLTCESEFPGIVNPDASSQAD